MFNWTNTHEILNPDVKPMLVECGPYVFLESHQRTNITWNENGTVTYNQIRSWQFMPDLSNGTLEDDITTLNVISAVRFFSSNFSLNLTDFIFVFTDRCLCSSTW